MAFNRIFVPIKIRSVEIPNRIFRSAHGTQFNPGKIDERLIAYHAERARSGLGLSILEIASVHPSSSTVALEVWDDSVIPTYRELMAAVRPHGMRVFQQLWHGGAQVTPVWGGAPWSASFLPGPYSPRRARPMTREEIAEIVLAYGKAAGRCQEGGLDGCEVQLGHGYLMQQFLSPLTNRREDEYGGSLTNRMRFAREVLKSVRTHVASGFPVGVRFSTDLSPGGLEAQDCAEIIGLLENEGLIDFVNGSQSSYFSLSQAVPAMDKPVGVMMPQVTTIVKGATRIPRLITPGRMRTLEEVEQVLRNDEADMVSMVRAMIAEPDLVRKSREGRLNEVRPCISCNQGCVAPAAAGLMIGCTVNAVIGLEATHSERLIERVKNPRKVVVVGGGPAGMEAARIAATMGHKVVLMEAGPHLGGLVNVAKRAPKLHTLGDFTSWLELEINRLGVEVQLNTYAEADDVLAQKPEAVIIATGGLARTDGVQRAIPGKPALGAWLPHVIAPTDLLTDAQRELGRCALVFDDIGHFEALSSVEYLLDRGLTVTFATRFTGISPGVEMTLRLEPTLERLLRHGERFRVRNRVRVAEIRAGEVDLVPLQGERIETLNADTVVFVLDRDPLRELYVTLSGKIDYLKIVGDAESPSDIQVAVREGHMAARGIPESVATNVKGRVTADSAG
jgi:2,4-dienoyl-CoA reductase-like NADH-dependent reductase (Old Yellow Enzyme family)